MSIKNLLERLQKVTEGYQNQWAALCPAHDDNEPSLSIGKGEDGQALLYCHAGCKTAEVVEALGLTLADLVPTSRDPDQLTTAALAAAKGINPDLLAKLGVVDDTEIGGVVVPYFDADGEPSPRARIRTALRAGQGSRWDSSDGPIVPYGLNRLDQAVREGYLILCEGETDCWTAWQEGFPALGIPGARQTGLLSAVDLSEIPDLYVIQEPDGGGEIFVPGVLSALREADWTGLLHSVELPAGDINEQYLVDRPGFVHRFNKALRSAPPRTVESGGEHVPELLDGPALVEQIRAVLARHVVLPECADIALVLWILHTHAIDQAEVTPLLHMSSPEPGCGKTVVLEVLEALVRDAHMTANTTPASLYRLIDDRAPTLLIDEADTFIRDRDELRGILNAGYRRTGKVDRTNTETYEVESFSAWAPKALASIAPLPDTLADRSIEIRMQRLMENEPVEYLGARGRAVMAPLRGRIDRWVTANWRSIRAARTVDPDGLVARSAEIWRPLLAIAELAGVGEEARHAAVMLSGQRRTRATNYGAQLLRDLSEYLHRRREEDGQVQVPTHVLLDHLNGLADSPWTDLRAGLGLDSRQLAKFLRPYEVGPCQIWDPDRGKVCRGYRLEDLLPVFSRYLPETKETGQVLGETGRTLNSTGKGQSHAPTGTEASQRAEVDAIVDMTMAANDARP